MAELTLAELQRQAQSFLSWSNGMIGMHWATTDHQQALQCVNNLVNTLTLVMNRQEELARHTPEESQVPEEASAPLPLPPVPGSVWVLLYLGPPPLLLGVVHDEALAKAIASVFLQMMRDPPGEFLDFGSVGWQMGFLWAYRTSISNGIDILRTFQYVLEQRDQESTP